jgi:hypothetical protein
VIRGMWLPSPLPLEGSNRFRGTGVFYPNSGADPEEVVDAEVTRIAKEKQSVSIGSGEAGGVCIETFDDGDQEERSEV